MPDPAQCGSRLPPEGATAALCVLASGSSGNCTVLTIRTCGARRTYLIDAGLSPRRTAKFLAHLGLSLESIDGVLLTHLDTDHWSSGWGRRLPERARVYLHPSHARRIKLRGQEGRTVPLQGSHELCPGVALSCRLAAHDEAGVAAYRFDFAECGSRLGFATDVGRFTDTLMDLFRGVDVLAIESNYCPRLQEASSRPWFLKRRIMGGAGHLSNEQALRAISAIGPRRHVVLLHLSRECNDPELVWMLHRNASYEVTITNQFEPTEWVPIARPAGSGRATLPHMQLPLFTSTVEPGARARHEVVA